MDGAPKPTWHPYRSTCGHDRRAARNLKGRQAEVLGALLHRCPRPGDEVSARVVSRDLGLRLGSLMLSLRSMAAQRLVVEHDADGEPTFSPTLMGRALLRDALTLTDRRRAA